MDSAADRPAVDVARGVGERQTDALGNGKPFLALGIVEHDRKLLAAETRGPVDRTDLLGEPASGLAQHGVARLVAMDVVDTLEMVEVDHEHRQDGVVAPRPVHLRHQPHRQGAPVEDLRQRVGVREHLEARVLRARRFQQLGADDFARREKAEEELRNLGLVAFDAIHKAQFHDDIEIAFTGTLNDKLRGWYRSTYRDAQGNEQVIATSQMQSTDCRRAFPCFDEPDFKAVFDITLVVQPQFLAVSNAPEVERTTQPDGMVAVRFAPTMPMSTYLVALVVGPLEATEPVLVPRLGGGDIPLRIIHVPGKAHLTAFGLDIGAFALGWYQEYYGIPYPSDKVDLIALPDFAAGAMENLGCITFREVLLLVDPATSTQIEQELVADVVAHELAHMWFGDLVTMGWWNGIWLNEAFATFMEIAACDAFAPEWKRWTSFGLERSAAFAGLGLEGFPEDAARFWQDAVTGRLWDGHARVRPRR